MRCNGFLRISLLLLVFASKALECAAGHKRLPGEPEQASTKRPRVSTHNDVIIKFGSQETTMLTVLVHLI